MEDAIDSNMFDVTSYDAAPDTNSKANLIRSNQFRYIRSVFSYVENISKNVSFLCVIFHYSSK